MRAFPPMSLRIETDRFELRLARDDELGDLAERAAGAVLAPEHAHFMGRWTQVPSPAFERSFCQYHWACRAQLGPARWRLPFAVFPAGERRAAGVMELNAADFAAARTCATGSWLLPQARGRGIGRAMRAAVLALAFDGLGAIRVRSQAHPGNAASRAVSLALGYREDGTDEGGADHDGAIYLRYRLEAADFRRPEGIAITGLDDCLALLGASGREPPARP